MVKYLAILQNAVVCRCSVYRKGDHYNFVVEAFVRGEQWKEIDMI
jgi:hypothetical protein